MPCQEEEDELDEARFELEKTQIEVDRQRRKAKNALKAAGSTCALGAFGGFFGVPGLIAGGGACIGGLLLADDIAGDYEAASELHNLAAQKHLHSFMQFLICSRRHEMIDEAVS